MDDESSRSVSLHGRRARDLTPSADIRLDWSERWTIVEVHGEMDVGVLPLLPRLSNRHAGLVVFELSGVTFMDGAGVGALMGSRVKARRLGGEVRLVVPGQDVGSGEPG